MKIKYFGASWCEPCKSYWPIVSNNSLTLNIEKIDVDNDPDEAAKYGVRGVPTIVLLHEDGEALAVKQGVMSKTALDSWLMTYFFG